MAHLLRLIAHGVLAVLACWLMLQPLAARAAFPAPSGTVYYSPYFGTGTTRATPLLICQAVGQAKGYGNEFTAGPGTSSGYCLNGVGLSSGDQWVAISAYTCPANSTLSGSQCTCNAGYVESGASCIVDPLVAACEALAGQVSYVTVPGQQAIGGSACGASGCTMTMGSPLIKAKNQAGAWITEGEATFTGATCDASAPSAPAAAEDPCPDGQPGQVNGQDVCIPYSPTDEVVRDTGSSTETTEGGNTTQTTTSTSTTCTGGSCNTTTTTTTVVNGGTPTTTTEETTEPRDEYCTKNPRAPQCRESSFGGSCGAGFTCEGDAVQCATARELHNISCGLQATSDEAALYEASADPAGGPADIPSESVSVGPGIFDASNALGVASCVADLAITVAGTAITLPLSDICPYLEYLRLMLLAVAWLMAFRIVAQG